MIYIYWSLGSEVKYIKIKHLRLNESLRCFQTQNAYMPTSHNMCLSTPKATHLYTHRSFSQQTQKRNHIVIGKEKWNRKSEINKSSNTIFLILKEMEMVGNESIHNNNSNAWKNDFSGCVLASQYHYIVHELVEECKQLLPKGPLITYTYA